MHMTDTKKTNENYMQSKIKKNTAVFTLQNVQKCQ